MRILTALCNAGASASCFCKMGERRDKGYWCLQKKTAKSARKSLVSLQNVIYPVLLESHTKNKFRGLVKTHTAPTREKLVQQCLVNCQLHLRWWIHDHWDSWMPFRYPLSTKTSDQFHSQKHSSKNEGAKWQVTRIKQQVWCWQQLPDSIEQETLGKNAPCIRLHSETIKLSTFKLFSKTYDKELEGEERNPPSFLQHILFLSVTVCLDNYWKDTQY